MPGLAVGPLRVPGARPTAGLRSAGPGTPRGGRSPWSRARSRSLRPGAGVSAWTAVALHGSDGILGHKPDAAPCVRGPDTGAARSARSFERSARACPPGGIRNRGTERGSAREASRRRCPARFPRAAGPGVRQVGRPPRSRAGGRSKGAAGRRTARHVRLEASDARFVPARRAIAADRIDPFAPPAAGRMRSDSRSAWMSAADRPAPRLAQGSIVAASFAVTARDITDTAPSSDRASFLAGTVGRRHGSPVARGPDAPRGIPARHRLGRRSPRPARPGPGSGSWRVMPRIPPPPRTRSLAPIRTTSRSRNAACMACGFRRRPGRGARHAYRKRVPSLVIGATERTDERDAPSPYGVVRGPATDESARTPPGSTGTAKWVPLGTMRSLGSLSARRWGGRPLREGRHAEGDISGAPRCALPLPEPHPFGRSGLWRNRPEPGCASIGQDRSVGGHRLHGPGVRTARNYGDPHPAPVQGIQRPGLPTFRQRGCDAFEGRRDPVFSAVTAVPRARSAADALAPRAIARRGRLSRSRARGPAPVG